MARYRVFQLRDDLSRRFREQPAGQVKKQLRQKDYAPAAEIEAENEYAAWRALQKPDANNRTLSVGDVLEPEGGPPRICLYGGFEEAVWYTPEAKPGAAAAAATIEARGDKPPDSQPDPPAGQPPDFPIDQPPVKRPPEPSPEEPLREPPEGQQPPRNDPPAPDSGSVEDPPRNQPPD